MQHAAWKRMKKKKNNVYLLSNVFTRLQAMKREIHLRELQLLDAVRRRFMHHQQTLKEAELQRLDDEIERKVSTTTGTQEILHKVIKCYVTAC